MKLDHMHMSQSEELKREQLKCIAVSLRAEESLRDLVAPAHAHEKEMARTMAASRMYRDRLTGRKKPARGKAADESKSIPDSQVEGPPEKHKCEDCGKFYKNISKHRGDDDTCPKKDQPQTKKRQSKSSDDNGSLGKQP